MASLLLACALASLLFGFQPSVVDAGGEYCHGWADTYNIWHDGFQCPERYDGEEARFCCGTCHLRYCCSTPESRLDQETCDNDSYLGFETEEQTSHKPPQVPTYLPFLIVASVFVSFVIVGSFVAVCCCRCLKPKAGEQQSGSVPIQSRLIESGPSSDGRTPSRHSSSSSSSASRCSAGGRPQNNICTMGTEGMNVYMSMPPPGSYPVMGCPPPQQYMPHNQTPSPFVQPHGYMGYGIPPEHAMLMAPAYIDSRAAYGQQHPFPQAPMHTEQLYPGVSL
ncbi:Protein shisa-1 [Acipenser ruthenus]|uniref:Protein shisa-1 n=1 Tax=Acipenser ruthenus TaxID=7906 RepID=A0A444UTG9_ACIRT|nr:Protein shisa-1 [Acipenser ruthenus]